MSLLYFIHVTFRSFICILQECWKMLAVYKRIVGILFLFFCLNKVCPSATHHSVWPTNKSHRFLPYRPQDHGSTLTPPYVEQR